MNRELLPKTVLVLPGQLLVVGQRRGVKLDMKFPTR